MLFFLSMYTIEHRYGLVLSPSTVVNSASEIVANAGSSKNQDVVQHQKTTTPVSIQTNKSTRPVRTITPTDNQQLPQVKPLNKQFSETELECLALNNYFEARSEPTAGQLAVANVVLNRVKHAGFPNTICAVVKQGSQKRLYHCQFSWWCDGLSDKPLEQRAWKKSRILARIILEKQYRDITSGALWYHADYVRPYWRTSMNKGPKIGRHIFYSARKRSTTKTTKTT
jgi:spore germination cell wall hydrolase CwlJ-like protein